MEINVNQLAAILEKHYSMNGVVIDKVWVSGFGCDAHIVHVGIGGQLSIAFSGEAAETEMERRVRELVDYCYGADRKCWRGYANMKNLAEYVSPLHEMTRRIK